MPTLVVSGITVRVTILTDVEENLVPIGETVRAFDGTPRSSVQDYARDLVVETVPLEAASADSLLAVLRLPGGVTCSGDFLGGVVGCVVSGIRVRHRRIHGGVLHKVITFTLMTGAG